MADQLWRRGHPGWPEDHVAQLIELFPIEPNLSIAIEAGAQPYVAVTLIEKLDAACLVCVTLRANPFAYRKYPSHAAQAN
jgi:hypothetical protein